jgi:hypothetical protein
MDILQLIVLAFGALIGFPAFLTALGNLLVYLKVGLNLDAFYFWGNVIGFGLVALAIFTGRLDILSSVDAALVGIAKVIMDLLILLGGVAGSLFFNYRMHNKVQELHLRNLFMKRGSG